MFYRNSLVLAKLVCVVKATLLFDRLTNVLACTMFNLREYLVICDLLGCHLH